MDPIIKHFTDNDLYKFTTMNAIQKLYPFSEVKYKFINRNTTSFPENFANALREQIDSMKNLKMTKDEENFIRNHCHYFDPVFIDLLKGYRYNPEEVTVIQKDGQIEITIEGYWYRAVLWEVPLLAIISELFFITTGKNPINVEENAKEKALRFKELKASYSEFGTRRRFSFNVHERVFCLLQQYSEDFLKGTSNLYFAMKYDANPIGTHPHEWFMFHASQYGYRMANVQSLKTWTTIYHGDLGIALTDTFTSDNFFESCTTEFAKLFDGLRWDSGNPLEFTDKAIAFYNKKKIDPRTKTIVYSDALDLEKVEKIKKHVNGRINDAYGIGTFLTNDTGVEPLNMVIKLSHARLNNSKRWVPTIKLSDSTDKYTGDFEEIDLCKKCLGLI